MLNADGAWLRGYDAAQQIGAAPPARRAAEPETESEAFWRWLRGVDGRGQASERARLERARALAPTPPVGPAPWDRVQSAPQALTRYLGLQPLPLPPDPVAAVVAALQERQAAYPLRGYTRGELAEIATRADGRRAAPRESGLVVDTELRETLGRFEGYDRRFTDRAQLLRAVQRIKGLRGHRVSVCLRYMVKKDRAPHQNGAACVEVVGHPFPRLAELCGEHPTPRYRGVAVCGNGWTCPVCAARVTEGRRRELELGVQRWRDGGGKVLLVTQTFSHGPNDSLRDAWQQFGAARARFARCADVKAFRAWSGFVGRIAAREVTFGVNGWHPHSHELQLVAVHVHELDVIEWRGRLARAWRASCRAVGLDCSLEHGFDCSLTEADTYIAKWGLDAELTKWHVKRGDVDPDKPAEGGLNGYTPFDLLRIHAGVLSADPRLQITSDRAAALFTEYAHAVKGTAQLHWTRGLKKTLAVDEQTDAELAQRGEPLETVLGVLTPEQWFAVVSGNHQVELLGIVDSQGWDVAALFVDAWFRECNNERARWARRQVRSQRILRALELGP